MLSLRPVWTIKLDSGDRDRNRKVNTHREMGVGEPEGGCSSVVKCLSAMLKLCV